MTRDKTVIRLPSMRKSARRRGAVCPRQPRAAPGNQPGQRARAGAEPWRAGRVAEPATDPDDDRRDGLRVRHALSARSAPAYGKAKIPAYEMIRFSVNIMRGCFGGCTFCSITEHEGPHHPEPLGRVDHSRDRRNPRQGAGLYRGDFRPRRADRQHVPHRLQEPGNRIRVPQAVCVFPGICPNLNTDHTR